MASRLMHALPLLITVSVCLSSPVFQQDVHPAVKRNKLRDVDWFAAGQSTLKQQLSLQPIVSQAKNVILFVGDGMGVNTITAARVFKAQQDDKSIQETKLSWQKFPYTALSAPYGIDHMTAESAQTATAMMTGVKINGKTVGVDMRVRRGNCSTFSDANRLKSILKYSHEAGKWTGVVTNTRITHATPSSAYANSPDRKWESDSTIPPSEKKCKDIAWQLVEENDFIRVIMGGGRQNFIPKNESDPEYPELKGRRDDGVNLMKRWYDNKLKTKGLSADRVKMVNVQKEFDAVDPAKTDYLLGLFEPGHMHFEIERKNEPSLSDMVAKAIKILQRSDKGYFLVVEGGLIDRAHHLNIAYKAMTEALSLSNAVETAVSMTDEQDTLIVTTADHSQGMVMMGYTHPDVDIMGVSKRVAYGAEDETYTMLGKDGLPWLTLTYANGPGYILHRTNGSLSGPEAVRRNVTMDAETNATRTGNYTQDAGFPYKSGSHAGEDVAIFARGPMAHLFSGAQEQNYIAHVMMYASCVGPNTDHCKGKRTNGSSSHHNSGGLYLLYVSLMAVLLLVR